MRDFPYRTVLVVPLSACLGAAFILVGCGEKDLGVRCYPNAARPWIQTLQEVTPGSSRDDQGPIHIYVDGSASMAGFIKGETSEEKPLGDLVGILPALEGLDHHSVTATRFDRKITDLAPSQLIGMEKEDAYTCPAANRNCDRQESHIDQVLLEVSKNQPKTLSLIISDLWLDNSSDRTTDPVALAPPLDAILDSGRSIAVYSFESPFEGRAGPLPSGAYAKPQRAYVYLLAIGPPSRIMALHDALSKAPSKALAGRGRYALFSLQPAFAPKQDASPLALPATGPFVSKPFLKIHEGVSIEEITLRRSSALRLGPSTLLAATWEGPRNDVAPEGAVWSGPSEGATTLYRHRSEECGETSWAESGRLSGGWNIDGRPAYRLDPLDVAQTLTPGDYLIVGKIQRTSVTRPNSATQWMRDQSFDASSEADAVRRPVMPTLRLADTARLLENALSSAAERHPIPVGGFAVALRVQP